MDTLISFYVSLTCIKGDLRVTQSKHYITSFLPMWKSLKPDTGSEYPQDNRVHLLCAALAALGTAAEEKKKGMS